LNHSVKKNIGVFIPIVVALGAYGLSYVSGLNFILAALILGIFVGNIIPLNEKFNAGIKAASGRVLETAIVLMAFSVNYKSLLNLGWELGIILLATVSFVIFITLVLSKRFNCPGSTGWLVGFGTAICGSSAIAALSPIVSKNKDDMALSLAVVNILGLIGMIVLPYLGQLYLTDMDLATLIGASLHSAGNVAGAGFVVNDAVGEMAVTIKLGRIALLTPALIVFQWAVGKRTEIEGKVATIKIPWYLIVFIGVSLLTTFVSIPEDILGYLKLTANYFLAVAMAAIGLKMNLAQVAKAGKKGLVFGTVVFLMQLGFILVLLALI
jgi:uncharacterized integral membrane protein (TIGR00698 family)